MNSPYPEATLEGEESPQSGAREFNAAYNNEKLLGQIQQRGRQRNMRRQQEYEIQRMLDFEAEERRNRAQLKFEMQLDKIRGYKHEQTLIKARNTRDPMQRAKLLIGDVALRKPAAVLPTLPVEQKSLKPAAGLMLNVVADTFANQCFFGIANASRGVQPALQRRFEHLIHAIYNRQTLLELDNSTVEQVSELIKCIPEYPFYVYVYQGNSSLKLKLPRFLSTTEVNALQSAANETTMRSAMEGPIAASLGWCFYLIITENATFCDAFYKGRCAASALARVFQFLLLRTCVKCLLVDDFTVRFYYKAKEYFLRFGRKRSINAVQGKPFFTDFPRFDATRDSRIVRVLGRETAAFVRTGSSADVEVSAKAAECCECGIIKLDHGLTLIDLKPMDVERNKAIELPVVPIVNIDINYIKIPSLAAEVLCLSNTSYFGIANSTRLVPASIGPLFDEFASQVYSGSYEVVLRGCIPEHMVCCIHMLPELPALQSVTYYGSDLRIYLYYRRDVQWRDLVQRAMRDLFIRAYLENVPAAVLGFCTGTRHGHYYQIEIQSPKELITFLHFSFLRVGIPARRLNDLIVEFIEKGNAYFVSSCFFDEVPVYGGVGSDYIGFPGLDLVSDLDLCQSCRYYDVTLFRSGSLAQAQHELVYAEVEGITIVALTNDIFRLDIDVEMAVNSLQKRKAKDKSEINNLDNSAYNEGLNTYDNDIVMHTSAFGNSSHFGIPISVRNLNPAHVELYELIIDKFYEFHQSFVLNGATASYVIQALAASPDISNFADYKVEYLYDGVMVVALTDLANVHTEHNAIYEQVAELVLRDNCGNPMASVLEEMLRCIGEGYPSEYVIKRTFLLLLRMGIRCTVVHHHYLCMDYQGKRMVVKRALNLGPVPDEIMQQFYAQPLGDFINEALEQDAKLVCRWKQPYTVLLRRIIGDPVVYVKSVLYAVHYAAEFAIIEVGKGNYALHLKIDWKYEETVRQIDELADKCSSIIRLSQAEQYYADEAQNNYSAKQMDPVCTDSYVVLSKADLLYLGYRFPGMPRYLICKISAGYENIDSALEAIHQHVLHLLESASETVKFDYQQACIGNMAVFGIPMNLRPLSANLQDTAFEFAMSILDGKSEYISKSVVDSELASVVLAFPEFLHLSPVVQDGKIVFKPISAYEKQVLGHAMQDLACIYDCLQYVVDFGLSLSGCGNVCTAFAELKCSRQAVPYAVQASLIRMGIHAAVVARKTHAYIGNYMIPLKFDDLEALHEAIHTRRFEPEIDVYRAEIFLSKGYTCVFMRAGSWFQDCGAVHEMTELLYENFGTLKYEVSERSGFWVYSLSKY